MILLSLNAYSQGFSKETDSLCFSYEAGMKMLQMKLRNDYLENQFVEFRLKFSRMEKELQLKDRKISEQEIQLRLLKDTGATYRDLYETEKDQKPKFWDKFIGKVQDIGIWSIIFGAGLFVGKLLL